MGLSGSEYRRLRGAGDGFGAGDGMVMVVGDVVGVVDGGCGAVAWGDVAALGKVLGGSTRVCVAVSVVWGVD